MNNDEELKQQEQKEEKKPSAKRIVGILILVDLVITIVFLLLFGLNRCSSNSGTSSSDSSSERYNSAELDNVFKKIVKTQMDDYSYDEDELTNVVAVSYADDSSKFNLTISVTSATKVYIYKIENSEYQGYEDFVSYLLANNNDIPLNGSVSLDVLTISNETVDTSKSNNHYVVGKNDLDEKFLSGYYYDNSGYHVYNKLLLDDIDPFNKQENQIINSGSLLYDYYSHQVLSI